LTVFFLPPAMVTVAKRTERKSSGRKVNTRDGGKGAIPRARPEILLTRLALEEQTTRAGLRAPLSHHNPHPKEMSGRQRCPLCLPGLGTCYLISVGHITSMVTHRRVLSIRLSAWCQVHLRNPRPVRLPHELLNTHRTPSSQSGTHLSARR